MAIVAVLFSGPVPNHSGWRPTTLVFLRVKCFDIVSTVLQHLRGSFNIPDWWLNIKAAVIFLLFIWSQVVIRIQ